MANLDHRAKNAASLAAGVGYAVFYLYAVGDVDVGGPPAWNVATVEMTIERVLAARVPFQFEAVAMMEAGVVVLLLSPLNILMAVLLGMLLAANLHGALYLHGNPRCRAGAGGALGGAMPALLAGGACCAPSLILLLGVPGLGAFSALFPWLVPLSIVALIVNRIWQRRQSAPTLIPLRRSA
jgi:hypothetical protein